MKPCRYCNTLFSPRATGGHVQAYCSPPCRMQHHADKARRLPTAPGVPNVKGGCSASCEQCGAGFTTRARPGGRPQRFCSDACSRAAWSVASAPAQWNNWLLREYGITGDQYAEQLERQNGCCAICGRTPKGNRLSVDHNHATGNVRGLLCAPCNRHLGYFEKFGAATQAYLSNPPFPAGFSVEASKHRTD